MDIVLPQAGVAVAAFGSELNATRWAEWARAAPPAGVRARPRPTEQHAAEPGRVLDLAPGTGVATGEGVLELLEVQLAGKSAMDVQLFAQGRRDFAGSKLGGEG